MAEGVLVLDDQGDGDDQRGGMMEQTLEKWEVGVSIDHTYPYCPWPVFRLKWMSDPCEGGTEIEAVRRLMDAVPDLLAACEAMLREAVDGEYNRDQDGNEWPEITAARAAIAKARGEGD